MKERLAQLRKALNMSMEAFGEKVGVGRSTISRLESGTNNFTDQMIRSICREFNVNYNWLVSGVGDMFAAVPQDAIDELCAQYSLDAFDRALIQEYLKMPAESRKALKDYVRNVMKRVSDDDPQAKINKEAEAYRKELEIEASRTEKSSASGTTAGEERMA